MESRAFLVLTIVIGAAACGPSAEAGPGSVGVGGGAFSSVTTGPESGAATASAQGSGGGAATSGAGAGVAGSSTATAASSSASTGSGGGSGEGPLVPATSCPAFPANNVWNRDISALPVHPQSAAWVASIGGTTLDVNFGTYDIEYGMPVTIVDNTTPLVAITFDDPSESDPGPYPFTASTPVELGSGGDRHCIMVNKDTCGLYELYLANWNGGAPTAGNGAIFSLTSNALRPDGVSSADDAGLSIFAGLLRYEDVASGAVKHAVRFTAYNTNQGLGTHLWPARYEASYLGGGSDPTRPPMGARFRLQASYDISSLSPDAQVVLNGLKHYGMFLADLGDPWAITGTMDSSWTHALLDELRTVPATAFEAVDESSLMIDPSSGEASQN